MIKKRLAGNMAANVFAQVANTTVQLASVPLFLAFWSTEHYGEWLLLFTIPSYIALSDAGLSNTAANDASMFVAQGQEDKARCSLHTATLLLSFAAGIIMLALATVAWWLPWTSWLQIHSVDNIEAAIVVLLLGFYTVLGLALSLYGVAYRATYRNPRSIYIFSTLRLTELAVTAVTVVSSNSYVVLSLGLLATRVVALLVVHLDVKRISPALRPGFAAFSAKEMQRTWRSSLLYMGIPLGNALYFQGLTVLTGRALGPVAVVSLTTCRALTRTIVQATGIIKMSILPEFSFLYGAGDFVRTRRLNALAFEITWISSLVLFVALYFSGSWIMSVWTHKAVEVGRGLLLLFLAGAILNSLWGVSLVFLISISRHGRLALFYLVVVGLSLLLACVLAPKLGLLGIGWAMLACEIVMLPYALIRACDLLQQPIAGLIIDTLLFRQSRTVASSQLHWLRKRYSG